MTYLTEDARSFLKNEKPYALKGEEVFVLYYHSNVVIVENKLGVRFTVKVDNLTRETI